MFRRGGEYGARTPVEARETKDVNQKTEVGIPLSQALLLGLLSMVVCATGILAARAMGQTMFWTLTLIFGLTNTFYFLVVEAKQGYSVTLPEFIVGILFCLSGGGLGLCIHQISKYVFPEWNVEAGWLNALIALTFVGSLVTFLTLALAFVQELAQRSYFAEEAIWGAIGKGLVAKFMKPKGRDPIIVHSAAPGQQKKKKATVEPVGEAETAVPVPDEWSQYDPRTAPSQDWKSTSDMLDEAEVEAEEEEKDWHKTEIQDIREFLVRGSKEIGFGRAKWDGIELSSGTVVTERTARRWIAMFKEAGMMRVVDGKTQLVVSLNTAIQSVN